MGRSASWSRMTTMTRCGEPLALSPAACAGAAPREKALSRIVPASAALLPLLFMEFSAGGGCGTVEETVTDDLSPQLVNSARHLTSRDLQTFKKRGCLEHPRDVPRGDVPERYRR